MRITFISIIAILCLCHIGCSRSKDILATYNGGSITRAEFTEWLKANQFDPDTITKSKSSQKDQLTSMCLEKVALLQNQTINKLKTDGLTSYLSLTEDGIIDSDYLNDILCKENVPLTIAHTRHIYINKSPNDKKRTDTIIRAIYQDLKNKNSFAEVARRYSQDRLRDKGGDAGFIIRSKVPKEYGDVAFSLKPGTYTINPVSSGKGIYIIQLEEKKNLSYKDAINTTDNELASIKQSLRLELINNYVNLLAKDSDVHFTEINPSTNPKSIVIKTGPTSLTYEDVRALRNSFMKYSSSNFTQPKSDFAADNQFAKDIFTLYLIKYNITKNRYVVTEETKRKVRAATDKILSKEVIAFESTRNIQITDKDAQTEYNRQKDKEFTSVVIVKGKPIQHTIPFNNVKDQILLRLTQRSKYAFETQWKQQAIKKYNITINERHF